MLVSCIGAIGLVGLVECQILARFGNGKTVRDLLDFFYNKA